MKRKFIVTADDFGVSPIIDLAIRDAIKRGIVTSVACFANGTDRNGLFSMQPIIDLKSEFPNVEIGCHFTITSGKRVSKNPSPLGRNSDNKKFRLATSQHAERATKLELIEEVQAQVDQFANAGIEIEHFSDHMGILSYSDVGMEALLEVVVKYSKSKRKAIPMRSPVFISCAGKLDDTCLGNSALVKKAGIGLVFRNTGLKVTNLFRRGAWQNLKINTKSLNAKLRDIHDAGVPTPDYFIESFYANASKKRLKCIQRNTPGTFYKISRPIEADVVRSELMVHLAVDPGKHITKTKYKKAIKELKEHGGVAIKYLRTKRVTEFKKLTRYFHTSFPQNEHGGFNH